MKVSDNTMKSACKAMKFGRKAIKVSCIEIKFDRNTIKSTSNRIKLSRIAIKSAGYTNKPGCIAMKATGNTIKTGIIAINSAKISPYNKKQITFVGLNVICFYFYLISRRKLHLILPAVLNKQQQLIISVRE